MKKNLLLLLVLLLIAPAQTEVTIRTAVKNIIGTQHGSVGFSFSHITAMFRYQNGYTAVQAKKAVLLSGYRGILVDSTLKYAGIQTEYRPKGLCTFAIKMGILDSEFDMLRLRLKTTELQEHHRLIRLYTVGVSFGLSKLTMRYDGNWYWGTPAFNLHDLGSFIAQPSFRLLASVQKLRITEWYVCSAGFFKIEGNLRNKTGESIASGMGQIIEIKNTVHIPALSHIKLSVWASYLYFSGHFSVRLTAGNQGYFLFPYRFYNNNTLVSGSALGFGGTFSYHKNRFGFDGSMLMYSIVHSTGNNSLHYKEKKSFLFNGREHQQTDPLPTLKGNHFLLFRFSFQYTFNTHTDISIGKTIPIPILPSILTKNHSPTSSHLSSVETIPIVDTFITGLSLQVTIRL